MEHNFNGKSPNPIQDWRKDQTPILLIDPPKKN